MGYTIDAGVLPLYLEKVADEIGRQPAPEKPKGKPLGLWDTPEEEQVPAWQPWQER